MNRRKFVAGSALFGGAALAFPHMAFAQADTDRRLLFILQRGAADGLATLAPVGEPAFAKQRGGLAEDYADVAQLDGLFALHPAFAKVGAMYAEGQALFVQAIASSYRERSHFDGQNLLETGGNKAYALRDGWLNRLVGLLPEGRNRALALSPSVPMILQGSHPVSSYAPSALPQADEGLIDRIAQLYESDPQLRGLLSDALKTRAMAGDSQMRDLRDAESAGTLAASLMKEPEGARVMMMESDGWDSHAGQRFQFRNLASRLDTMMGAFQAEMGADWGNTLVIVATEFGRTVALNGTGGTDHGTGGAMLLLGGAVNGGRILADWPGLRQGDLYEERDLRPTGSTEAHIAGAIAAHFRIEPQLAMRTLFPDRTSRPVEGLLRA
ncbi:DUF1501 domain-containing protein [Erythrobacter jejuensis]|uniref:DUF1501 domain-containing protein n=1 Tax=Parerythrobacter jejuensis TaxID=795812 RepID=A0A845ASS1_9SPHN|nr:DUF1501 domain-containing protein [Parerythrobacter jejuensis]